MKAASAKEINAGLNEMTQPDLVKLCLRLARFKKENKELITYLLFEAEDEAGYVREVNAALDTLFAEVNTKQLYFAKKTLRKIIRTANRYIRYSTSDATAADVLIHTAQRIQGLGLDLKKNTALFNLYQSLVKKISKAIDGMHEDMQYDYRRAAQSLRAG